ncbi:exosome complex protein Rrp4 [Candidatus Woesearchaeota archaeon]|nr:exosome complex protein Rrp4 [Candidatus Woesearchaeota archaeon]MBW3017204.1 exosome complex protein Rrp4 [Candidatus Woesearchaeota archaeon]
MGLVVEDKAIVAPGEVLAQGMDYLPGDNAFRENDKVISIRLGLVNVDGRAIKVIPLAGTYLPKRGDQIICRVDDISYSGWRVDTNTAYSAMLSMKDASSRYIERGADLSRIYGIGDYIIAEVTNVTSQNLIDISMKGPRLKKLIGGRIIQVSSCKVPRLIGRKGSMVSMIKDATGCEIIVGQNGLVWIKGEPENELLAVETIRLVEKKSHKSGLTEEVEKFLKENGATGTVGRSSVNSENSADSAESE